MSLPEKMTFLSPVLQCASLASMNPVKELLGLLYLFTILNLLSVYNIAN